MDDREDEYRSLVKDFVVWCQRHQLGWRQRTLNKLLVITDDASHPLYTVIIAHRTLFSDRLPLPRRKTSRPKISSSWRWRPGEGEMEQCTLSSIIKTCVMSQGGSLHPVLCCDWNLHFPEGS